MNMIAALWARIRGPIPEPGTFWLDGSPQRGALFIVGSVGHAGVHVHRVHVTLKPGVFVRPKQPSELVSVFRFNRRFQPSNKS